MRSNALVERCYICHIRRYARAISEKKTSVHVKWRRSNKSDILHHLTAHGFLLAVFVEDLSEVDSDTGGVVLMMFFLKRFIINFVCMYVCMCVYMYACMYVCMYVYLFII